MKAQPEQTVDCPRCGYDQRGTIATWCDSCPLSATCTECGLRFLCAEVFHPEKFEPLWCVEFCAPAPISFLRSCFSTFARSFVSWHFWSRLKMSHRIRPMRIALYLLALTAPLILLYVAAQTTAALHTWSIMQSHLAELAAQDAILISQNWAYVPDERIVLYKEHYGDDWERYVELEHEVWEAQRAAAEERQQNPVNVNGTWLHAVAEAIFMPTARTSRITITNGPFVVSSYLPPSEIWRYAIDSILATTGGNQRQQWLFSWLDLARTTGICLFWGIALGLAFPLSLALLPVSRRKAKVRWAHIGRISGYWGGIVMAVIYIWVIALVAEILIGFATSRTGVPEAALAIAIAGLPFATILWWCFALNRHLKIPHALAITGLLMFLCALAMLVLVYLLAPHWLFGPYVY